MNTRHGLCVREWNDVACYCHTKISKCAQKTLDARRLWLMLLVVGLCHLDNEWRTQSITPIRYTHAMPDAYKPWMMFSAMLDVAWPTREGKERCLIVDTHMPRLIRVGLDWYHKPKSKVSIKICTSKLMRVGLQGWFVTLARYLWTNMCRECMMLARNIKCWLTDMWREWAMLTDQV